MENLIIQNFISFLRKQNCIVPEKFITNYYILTKSIFVSLTDCIGWLDIQRDGIMKTLKTTYKKNIDYFEITLDEEINITKIYSKKLNKKNYNKKYIKLTVDCFKKISMSSNSQNGKLTKQYYIEMERIVKDFSEQELKRNLSPITISDKEGLYVWHENQILKYRIGSGKILKRRIKQHNSSHADNIIVDYCLETTCYKDLELMVLKILDTKRYRENKDFFDCDIKLIKKVITKINDLLLEFRDNCDEITINNISKTKL